VLLAGQTGDLCIRWDVAESFAGERYGLRLVTEPRVEAIEQQAAIDQLVGERCFPIAETFTDVIADPDKPNLYYIRMGTVERATGNLVNVSTETKVVQLFVPACWVRTNEAVWMREGPGMEFAERGRMAPRDRVFPQSSPLRLRDLNQADIWWTPVIVANDPRVGWIQASNLDCPVPIDVLPANGQIPATPTPTPTPSPTATPLPTVTPTPVPEPSFSVDPRIIEQGECAMLKWSIQNVERVYLDGEGVVGEGERRVCPPDEGVVVYTWLIVNKDGTQMQRSVTLDVNED
jgi:hypothetical protein